MSAEEDGPADNDPARTTRWLGDPPGLGLRGYDSGMQVWVVQTRMHGAAQNGDARLCCIPGSRDGRKRARQVLARAEMCAPAPWPLPRAWRVGTLERRPVSGRSAGTRGAAGPGHRGACLARHASGHPSGIEPLRRGWGAGVQGPELSSDPRLERAPLAVQRGPDRMADRAAQGAIGPGGLNRPGFAGG